MSRRNDVLSTVGIILHCGRQAYRKLYAGNTYRPWEKEMEGLSEKDHVASFTTRFILHAETDPTKERRQ
jgi:hypothetical protein